MMDILYAVGAVAVFAVLGAGMAFSMKGVEKSYQPIREAFHNNK